jgi:MraZ protein
MLLGKYFGVISHKRRTAIPKKILEQLGSKIYFAKWYEECLVLVGEEGFNALLEKLIGKPKIMTGGIRETERFILGSSFELIPDSQGRVVLPTELVNYADLKDKLIFLGLGNRIEVWAWERWLEKEKSLNLKAEKIIERLGKENGKS